MPISPAAALALNLAAHFGRLPEDTNSGRRMPTISRKSQVRTRGELSKRTILVDPSSVDDAAGRFSTSARMRFRLRSA